jgi:preprotein translocase subunit YajC
MESLALFLPFLLIMGGFMYFSSRRQRRAMQATIDLHESLQPGDRVHTTSGMQATVVAIADDTVDLEIAPGVVTTWMKLAIRDQILPDEPEDSDEDEDLDEHDEHGDLDEDEGPENPADVDDASRATKDS